MNAERWQQIERIFQSALALKGSEERADYVNRACAEDEAMQQEVESLLAAYEKTGSFMNVPAHEVAAHLLAADGFGLPEGRQDDSTKLLAAPDTWTIGEDHQAQDTKLVISRQRRIVLVGIFFAGLWFSYSQSSMAALFVVTLALAMVAGHRALRMVAVVTALVVALAGAGLIVASVGRHSLKQVTSDRSRRIELTVKVVRSHPLAGVGLGGQALASRARSSQGGSPTRFVSHTTPLTIAAELGLIGLAAYLALLAGAGALIARVRRRDPALGLGLAATLLALFVHSLFYSGFLEDPVTWLVLAVASSFVLSRADDDAILKP